MMRPLKPSIGIPTGMAFIVLVAAVFTLVGCRGEIPLFNPEASTLNRAASAEELLIEINGQLARLRDAGALSQHDIDKAFTPSLNRAKQIIFATRAIARGRPTTQPDGTLDDARDILLSVKAVLEQIQRSRT